jgi:hypothetical protein
MGPLGCALVENWSGLKVVLLVLLVSLVLLGVHRGKGGKGLVV